MKKILIITISIIMLLGTYQGCQALILEYPNIEGAVRPGDAQPGRELPELIRYIFLFSLGLVGFVALLSMMIAAVLYVTSAGNPSKMGDAKDRIMSAVLGIIILLASVLILQTISPDLVNIRLRMPTIQPENGGGGGGGTPRNIGCYCIDFDGNPDFQGQYWCYNSVSDCTAPCVALCTPSGFTSACTDRYGDCQ